MQGPFLLVLAGAAIGLRRPGARALTVVYGLSVLATVTSALLYAVVAQPQEGQILGFGMAAVNRSLTMLFVGASWAGVRPAARALSGRAPADWPNIPRLLLVGVVAAAVAAAIRSFPFHGPQAALYEELAARGLMPLLLAQAALTTWHESRSASRNRLGLQLVAAGFAVIVGRQLFMMYVVVRAYHGTDLASGTVIFGYSLSTVLQGAALLAATMIEERSENRARAAEILNSEGRYRELVERSPAPTLVLRDGTIIYANPAADRLFGSGVSHPLVGERVVNRVHPDDRHLAVARLKRLADGAASVPRTEYRYCTMDGTPIDVEVESTVIQFDGAPAVHAVMRDVTAQRTAETERLSLAAQLQQAQRMEPVGRLAGGVAHDFNNMLGVILGHADLALERLTPDDPLHAEFLDIRDAAMRSADLTRQLLTYARRQIIAPRTVDLNRTVTDALRMVRRLIGENITIKAHSDASLWSVFMDPTQLDQILINLCVNSRDAIADVGTITISTDNVVVSGAHDAAQLGATPGKYVRLSVQDDGAGMDGETQARIFEPFFTTKGVGEGTGLGLATVYGAVQQNGGVIMVSSAPGSGTTFDIYLPRHVAPDDATEGDGAPAAAARGSETILLVEDDPGMLRLSALMLESQGYTVLQASAPADAVRFATTYGGAIDLLMSDVVMPGMNGRDLATRVAEARPGIRRLFVSGYPAGAIERRGILEAGLHFLSKPFTRGVLAAKVREVLDEPLPQVPQPSATRSIH